MRYRPVVMSKRLVVGSFVLWTCTFGPPCPTVWSAASPPSNSGASQETVQGEACYTYGDSETPAKARRAAIALAQEEAVRSHRVFVQSATKVKKLQLEDDVVQTASAALLERIRVDKEDKRGQEICVAITAVLSPISMEELLRQQMNAKEISDKAVTVVPHASSPGTRVWTNKSDGHYVEGERLIIYVRSDQDAYLKLDYFQADATVVHLVPNQFRREGMLKAGRVYAFGDDASPEQFIVQGPFGAETITAIFSARPFESSVNGRSERGDSREYLQALEGSRGIKVEATSHSVTLNTASKAVEHYRKDRDVALADSTQ
jgi:hypothetical protein